MIYTTKPDGSTSVTLARTGDTALVIDTSGPRTSGDSLVAANPMSSGDASGTGQRPAPILPAGTGSANPPVVPADLDALKSEGPIVPVAGVATKDLTDSFDDARGGGSRKHEALDIMAARNTPVLSALSGIVLKFHNSVAGGLTIYASDPTNRYVFMYGHLDSYKPGLKEGDALKKGEIIGFVGSTGDASPNAPHLHIAITRNDNVKEWWKGTPLNPFLVYR